MIRRRLTAAVVALVAAAGLLAAGGIVNVLEDRLVAAIDDDLAQVPDDVTRAVALALQRRLDPATFDVRRVAFVRVGPGGAVIGSLASGPAGAPDPLPDVTAVPAAADGPVTVPAVAGGGPDYRIVQSSLPGGGRLYTAISLGEVDATLAEVRRVLLVVGVAGLAAVGLAGWAVIRLGLRPIDTMVTTAQRIADGHIAERVAVRSPGSEVGRLGAALNRMLDRIGAALAARSASEDRMRRFVADAGHELRTPLTAIRGYAELAGQAHDPEERAMAITRVEHAAVRMGGLVDDLVLLARLDQGRPLAREPVDLARVVADALADARTLEPRRPVDVQVPEAGAGVTGDEARLRQVVDNLLANVREHTPAGTRVLVTVEPRDADVVVTVADDGPGMSAEEVTHAFDRFWQAPPTALHPRSGTGLGLAIVADLVRAHGGTVALDAEPGAGTRVTVTVPRAGSQVVPIPA
ncbi:MAG TPA: HAMP domain-containing sensor histidine kinase [Acidimicrobiales bacterium]|nr:HAMP domain-containing sensor histidine kinase [Acidimicrobiales bacterium]